MKIHLNVPTWIHEIHTILVGNCIVVYKNSVLNIEISSIHIINSVKSRVINKFMWEWNPIWCTDKASNSQDLSM